MIKNNLKLDYADIKSSRYAVMNWHYSKSMPVGKLVKIGVWENSKFIGVVLFGRGANKSLGKPYGLDQTESCELVRIALNNHLAPVSRIIRIALIFLKKTNPRLKLVVSFADTNQNHNGAIYQATNWIYDGLTNSADEYIYKGKRWHGRAFRKSNGSHLNYINKGLVIVKGAQKHRYLMPLTKELKSDMGKLAKPYPKRIKQATTGDHPDSGGATPTNTLHTNEVA